MHCRARADAELEGAVSLPKGQVVVVDSLSMMNPAIHKSPEKYDAPPVLRDAQAARRRAQERARFHIAPTTPSSDTASTPVPAASSRCSRPATSKRASTGHLDRMITFSSLKPSYRG
ncbi:hypothetical protein GGTG_09558 [Gaeumannomyces tritici R3-111a-1]|uniref:Uncharacterized protein n=1 Tax=Gaeumannomyces tritici (strain R3-111a-1) TaxID=644352 RepID=J3P7R6_GAET3|nr:hypothetical protein GGTG_09558 [Gaeumannomyces tritici R3-111a-1]EJT72699.1 hypothetical protein GGTG_09558 [Gaeumannomyces tritici R3-111a-1]